MKIRKTVLIGLILAVVMTLGFPAISGAFARVVVPDNAPMATSYLFTCTTLDTGLMKCIDPGSMPNVSWNS
jgi:hypothetical protein